MKNKVITYIALAGLFNYTAIFGMLQPKPTLPINFSTESRSNHRQARNGKLKIDGDEYTIKFLEPCLPGRKAPEKTITLPLDPMQREFIKTQTDKFSLFHINGGFKNEYGIYSIKIVQVIEENKSCQLQ
jgi:hypothetical protein